MKDLYMWKDIRYSIILFLFLLFFVLCFFLDAKLHVWDRQVIEKEIYSVLHSHEKGY